MRRLGLGFPPIELRVATMEDKPAFVRAIMDMLTTWQNYLVERLDHLEGSATYNPPNLTPAATTTTTVTVSKAALGDAVVFVSFSLDLQGLIVTAYVSAADTVTVVLFNPTGGAINLASGTLRAGVRK